MDDLIWGADVRTRDGVEGTLVKVGEHGSLRLRWPDHTRQVNRKEELYAVLLSTGEVRFFTEDALITVV